MRSWLRWTFGAIAMREFCNSALCSLCWALLALRSCPLAIAAALLCVLAIVWAHRHQAIALTEYAQRQSVGICEGVTKNLRNLQTLDTSIHIHNNLCFWVTSISPTTSSQGGGAKVSKRFTSFVALTGCQRGPPLPIIKVQRRASRMSNEALGDRVDYVQWGSTSWVNKCGVKPIGHEGQKGALMDLNSDCYSWPFSQGFGAIEDGRSQTFLDIDTMCHATSI